MSTPRDEDKKQRRRGRGDGAVYQRPDGTWCAQIDMGYTPDGKRDRRTVYGKTKSEVARKLNDLKAEKDKGDVAKPTRITVAEYLEQWLVTLAGGSVQPVTVESYRTMIRNHVLPMIGGQRLRDLTPMQIQQLYDDRIAVGKSRRTVEYVHGILHRALGQAVMPYRYLNRNPCDGLNVPKPERYEHTTLTPQQLEVLAGVLNEDRLGALYLLAAASGMRRAELVALRWSDIDMDRGILHLNRAAERVKREGQQYEVILTEPKNKTSRRSIPLTAGTVSLLRTHRVRQNEERLQQGEDWTDEDLVFPRITGRPNDPGYISHHFQVLRERAGLPHLRPHDLRHTHATLLLAANIHPKIVAERLGHSTTRLTLDLYSHVLPTMQQGVLDALDQVLPTEGKKQPNQRKTSHGV